MDAEQECVERLRQRIRPGFGNIVITVDADGSLECAWSGIADGNGVEALYAAADEIVRAKIPPRKHSVH